MFGSREEKTPPNGLKPIIDYESQIFAIERAHQQISALVYSGDKRVRRVGFTQDQKVSLDWEYAVEDLEHCGRVGDILILPGKNKGLRAIDLVSGATRWEVGYESTICKPLYQSGDSLFAFFLDQAWLEIDPKTGGTRANGMLSNEDTLRSFQKGKQRVIPQTHTEVQCQNSTIEIRFDGLGVKIEPEERAPKYERNPPPPGEYPIEDWKPNDGITIINKKLAVWLYRQWSGKYSTAIGLFELPSLNPLRLIQLGENTSGDTCHNLHEVDGLLFAGGYIQRPDQARDYTHAKFLIDPIDESLIAAFVGGANSVFFSSERAYWWGAL